LLFCSVLGSLPWGAHPLPFNPKNLGKSAGVLLSWQSRNDNSDSISWDSYSPIESHAYYSILLLYYRRYVLNAFSIYFRVSLLNVAVIVVVVVVVIVILISNLVVIVVVVILDMNSCNEVSLLQMLQELGDAHGHRDPIFIEHTCHKILTLLIGSLLSAQRYCTIYDAPIKVHPLAVS